MPHFAGAAIHPSLTKSGGSAIALKHPAVPIAIARGAIPWIFRGGAELSRALDLSDPGSGLPQIGAEESGPSPSVTRGSQNGAQL